MAYQIGKKAKEQGTYIIVLEFTDTNDNPYYPKTLKWSLTDIEGNAINSRDEVEVQNPLDTTTISLSGSDLAIGTNGHQRLLAVQATYDSSTYGNDLPLNCDILFTIEDIVAISD